MKIWLISQNVNNAWDTFDSAVVAAETEEEARNTYPNSVDTLWDGTKWIYYRLDGTAAIARASCWTIPDNVDVKFLADGYDGPAGTICTSFNAG